MVKNSNRNGMPKTRLSQANVVIRKNRCWAYKQKSQEKCFRRLLTCSCNQITRRI